MFRIFFEGEVGICFFVVVILGVFLGGGGLSTMIWDKFGQV